VEVTEAGPRVGVDVGGTFTDVVVHHSGELLVYKLSSTPRYPSDAVVAGVRHATAEYQGRLAELRHGTTVATNAIIEGKGAEVAFVTTEGFEDLLELGRQNRRELYSLVQEASEPIIPQCRCFGVPERVLADGSVSKRLELEVAKELARRVKDSGATAVAVCLLFSYLYEGHERLLEELLKDEGLFVSRSSEILPLPNEYERACATVHNAQVAKLMDEYLEKMELELEPRRFWVMGSCGSAMPLALARRRAVETALSGPAAGVAGATRIAAREGFEDLVTIDMGGTSTDVALVVQGRASLTRSSEIAGRPLGVETLDIMTIGAGGGSVAEVDEAGVLQVGPKSAGAVPGPACYGHGGPCTVTDANVVLRRLSPDWFLDGRMALVVDASRKVVAEQAKRAGLGVEEMALGILAVARSNMERAVRRISVERGHDPRYFTLVAFGGAGPLHAVALAKSLGMPRVLVPPDPGALCALGALTADEVTVHRETVLLNVGPAARNVPRREIELLFEELERRPDCSLLVERSLELRYCGQSSTIELSWSDNGQSLGHRFSRLHNALHGYDHGDVDVEIVSLTVRIRKPFGRFECSTDSLDVTADVGAVARVWPVTFDEGVIDTSYYDRRLLSVGTVIEGPAIIGEHTSTLLIEPGTRARVLSGGSLLVGMGASE